jgi:hypothetical protein
MMVFGVSGHDRYDTIRRDETGTHETLQGSIARSSNQVSDKRPPLQKAKEPPSGMKKSLSMTTSSQREKWIGKRHR